MKITKQDTECDSYTNLDNSNVRTGGKQHIYGRNVVLEQLDRIVKIVRIENNDVRKQRRIHKSSHYVFRLVLKKIKGLFFHKTTSTYRCALFLCYYLPRLSNNTYSLKF